jgi:hypothetical protein
VLRLTVLWVKILGTHKGVIQGDPISPLFFNLIGDTLARMIRKEHENNNVCGLVPHLIS